ncbi:MAG: 50S ribosomal protein L32e [ANME-2 cluster archaeon]|nr:50S ribosomal protein L32e [ANME-2 cluster archaeon]MBC2700053.1 50S ribosomal protein L32e [ANME-2 cluster archaeon]MBC2707430.1 50S ribosomal protein L32e [ANME-2 cluster archaeon]MBC2746349.1 50S ribosomal protein L32e [ANME-2 cluster archaeon]MBC2763635.1 50S ribosomal protein L32e [ANME-2 cluster archaeon]
MEEEIINEFTSIKGVGESRAKALYEAGYTSIGDLNDATAEELSRVRGITDQLAERIKNEVSQIYEDIEAGEAVEESTQEVVRTEKVEAEKEFEEQAGEDDDENKEIEAVPKAELELDPESQRLLKVRKKQKAKKPNFVQTDLHKKKRLKNYWRRPKGLHNKKRRYILGKSGMARVGYGSPVAVKGLHPSGFQDMLMSRVQDLDEIDPSTQAVRIARTVGQRKRMEIVNKARSLGLKILNPPTEMHPVEEEVQ